MPCQVGFLDKLLRTVGAAVSGPEVDKLVFSEHFSGLQGKVTDLL